jgi:dTDP-4-amino-4,6-dideoxygalactose transaminase
LNGEPAFAEPVYITKALVPDREVFDRHVRSIFDAQWFTNHGALVQELEATLRAHLDVGFLAAFCNGTTAIQAALRSLNLRGEVVTTPFTFPATIHAIHWCGLTPVFADIDPETYNLDPTAAAAAVTDETAALLPVHCFGRPCDVVAFERLASSRGLGLVYDAAHSFGVQHKGRPIGSWGDLSVLSFHATKVFHTAEGGAVIGPEAGRYADLSMLRNFAIRNEDEVVGTGVNGKLSELHAAVGLSVLGAALHEFEQRGVLAARYRERLAEIDGIVVREPAADTEPNHAYFPIEIDEAAFGLSRDELHDALRAENVFARKYFHPLCSENEAYRGHPSAEPARLPNAHRLAACILCLPTYGDLGLASIDLIADRLAAIRAHAPRIREALRTS